MQKKVLCIHRNNFQLCLYFLANKKSLVRELKIIYGLFTTLTAREAVWSVTRKRYETQCNYTCSSEVSRMMCCDLMKACDTHGWFQFQPSSKTCSFDSIIF